jgi:hypothetical protein
MAERSTPAIGKDELAGEMWLTVSMRSGARRGNTTEAVTRERTSSLMERANDRNSGS